MTVDVNASIFTLRIPNMVMDFRIYSCPTSIDVKDLIMKMRQLNEGMRPGFLQLVDASRVLSEQHLVTACWHAVYAFQENINISRSMEIEMLLYLAATRQIEQALTIVGLSDNTKEAILVNVQNSPDNVEKAFQVFEESFSWNSSPNQIIQPSRDDVEQVLPLYLGKKESEISSHFLSHIKEHYRDDDAGFIQFCVKWIMGKIALTATLV